MVGIYHEPVCVCVFFQQGHFPRIGLWKMPRAGLCQILQTLSLYAYISPGLQSVDDAGPGLWNMHELVCAYDEKVHGPVCAYARKLHRPVCASSNGGQKARTHKSSGYLVCGLSDLS